MSNIVFRSETEDGFLEIADTPHSTGHEDSLTKRIYRQVEHC